MMNELEMICFEVLIKFYKFILIKRGDLISKKYILVLMVVIAILISMASVSASDVDNSTLSSDGDTILGAPDDVVDIYVDSSASDGNGSQEKPYSNIKSAMDVIENGKTTNIHIASGVYNTSENYGFTLGKGYNISFIGENKENTIIQLDTSSFIAESDWSGVNNHYSFTNLKFTGGNFNYVYIIQAYSSTLVVDNCIFENVKTNYFTVYASPADIKNTIFRNITGGVMVTGFDYAGDQSEVSYISNCTFENCGDGSNQIVYCSANTYIDNCTFNKCMGSEGTINVYSLDTFISNTSFIDCSAKNRGAAIYSNANLYILENVNIVNCTSPKDNGIYVLFLKNIKSKINITFLDNKTVYSQSAHPVIYATVTDEYGHPISSLMNVLVKNDDVSITLDDYIVNGRFSSTASDLNGTYTVTYEINSFSSTNCTVLNGTLIVDPMENIDVYVANDGSDEDGNGTIENPYATIEKGLKAASDAINANLYIKSGNYNLSSIVWDSKGNLVIDSYGDVNPVIDVLGSNSLINVFSPTGPITLSNLDFVNFTASSSGFISSWGPNIIIDGCNFYNASSFGNGYLIVTWSGACLNITNSKLILNKSNIAILRPISSSIYINNSQFVNNGGNLIEANNGNDNLIIESSIFDGGPIPTISCTNVEISNSKFINNARIELAVCSVCNIINSTFENNTIINNDGGSLYVRASSVKLKIVGSKFINSQARNGAAIYFQPNVNCEVYLENNTAINCVANTDNFIYAQEGRNSVRFTSDIYLTFLNNSTFSIDSIQLPLSAVLTDENGNTISGPTVSFTIDGDLVSESNTLINGSADVKVKYYVNGTAVVSGSTSIKTSNLIVKTGTINATPLENIDVYVAVDGNDETGDGSQENPYATLEKALEVASTALNSNVYVKSGKYNLTTFQDFNTVGGLLSIIGYGGEVEIDMGNKIGFGSVSTANSNVLISNIKFINGYESSYNNGIITSKGNLTIINCTFENNVGLYTTIYSSGSALKVVSSLFINNNPRYTYYSSDIYAWYSEIIDSTFTGLNNRHNVYVTSGSFIDNCTFNNGRVYISGGKIIVNNSNFLDNTARAIDISGSSALVNVTNSKFINNTGLNNQVSIFHNGAGLYLENNTVTDSKSPFYVYSSYRQISHVDVIVGGNQTKDVEAFFIPMTAVVVDDNGNKIQLASINFYLNGELSGLGAFSNGEAKYTYSNLDGVYVFSADSPYLSDYTIKTSTLNITPKLYMDLYVDVDGSDEEGDGSQEHPYATIGHAVANAGALESVIHVGDGVFNPDSALAISSSGGKISIIGSGNTVIDLKKERRFIDSISTDSIVLLKDLSIINGYYAGMGGTIYNSGNLTIDNVLFINSTATSAGGTIINYGNYAQLYVLNSKFINSTALTGGAITNINGYLYLKNNTAENVIATGGNGNYVFAQGTVDGVVLTLNDNATYEITDSSVTLNATVSDDNGNPISGRNIPISFTLNGTNVATANLQGDVATATVNLNLNGDYVLSGALGSAENNIVKTAILKFSNADVLNEAWVSENGDDNNNGSADAPFKTVSKALSVLQSIGGTVHFVGDSYDLPATITVSGFNDLTFTSEESTLIHSSDYQLFNVLSGSSVTLSNLNITGSYNSGSESTAGLIRSAGKVYVDNCNIVNNKFLSAGSNGLIFYNNGGSLVINNTLFANNDLSGKYSGDTYGLGVYSTGTFSMYNSVVENNNITRFNLYSSSNSFIYSTRAMEINNCNFTNIGMEKQGTSLVNYGFIYNSAVNSKIVDCNFVNFTGYGVIYAYSGNLLVDNCKFINFTMSISANNMALAIYTLRSSVDVYNSLFKNISLSTSSVIGGAMGNTGYEYNIVNNTFDDNTLSIILNLGYDSLVTGNKFINNNYSSDCIKMTNCILTAFNNTFDNNVGKLEVYTLDNSEAKITGSTYTVVFSDNSTYEINGNSFTVNATLKDADGNYISTPITFKLNETAIGEAIPNNGIATLPVKQTFNDTYVLSGDVESIYDSDSLIKFNSVYTINAIENVVIYVDVFGNDVKGDGSEDKPYKTLERALQDANGINNTIYVLAGTYDALSNSDLNVAMAPGSSLSIIGLNQGSDEVIFDFENSNVKFIEFTTPDASFTLSNVKFVNINCTSRYFIGSVLPVILDNVSVSDSFVQSVFISCDNVNMYNCEFENVVGGSYINSNYGSIYSSYYNIVNSTFKNNVFSLGILEGIAELNVLSSVFINNDGGVLYGGVYNGKYNFTNCVIMNNTYMGAPNFAHNSGILDANDNWWGYNTDIESIYALIANSLTVSLNSWVVADVTPSELPIKENSTITVKFLSNDGSELENILPARIVEAVADSAIFENGQNNISYTINGNEVSFTVLPDAFGTVNLTVDNQEFTLNIVKANSTVLLDVFDTTTVDGLTTVATVNDDATGEVVFTLSNGDSYTVNIINGAATLFLEDILSGEYNITAVYGGDDFYNGNEASASFKVTDIIISADDVKFAYKDPNAELVASVADENGNPLVVNLNVEFNGENFTVTTGDDGQAVIPLGNLTPGKYNAIISYQGLSKAASANALVTVTKAATSISADDVNIAYKDPKGEIVATIISEHGKGLAVNLNVEFNGKNYTVRTDSNGQAVIPVGNLTPGKYNAKISYKGSINYKASSANALVTVTKAATSISADDVNIAYKDPSGEIVATIISEHGKTLAVNLNVEFNGKTYTVRTDANGQAIIPVGNLTPGTYDAVISYKGSSNYKASSANALVTVTKAATSIDAGDVNIAYRDPSGELVATVTNEHGKTLIVTLNIELNGKTYNVRTDANGQAVLSLYDVTPGTYDAKISYKGSSNYEGFTTTAKVVVTKAATSIDAGDVNIAYRDPSGELVATVTNEHGKTLIVTLNIELNGKTYNVRTDANGQAVLSLYDVTPGTYDAKISYKGSSNYEGFTTTAKVVVTKAATSIDAGDVNIAYRDPSGELVATVTNEHGKTLIVTLNIELNGKTYSVRTDANGQAVLSLYDVTPGTYDAKISYKGSSNYKGFTTTAKVVVTKSDTIISAPDVSVAYCDADGKLVSTIVNEHGKPLVVTMKVELDGKTFSARSDSNGQINVSTADLAPGSYVAKISYKGSSNYNPTNTTANITVKP